MHDNTCTTSKEMNWHSGFDIYICVSSASFLELVSVESRASELYETLRKLWSDRT